MNNIYKYKMKKNLLIAIALIMPVFVFSQARLVLNDSVYIKLYGGTASGSGAYLVIDDSASNAITQVTAGRGFIVSEKEFNMVKWDIKKSTGSFTIPYYDSTDSYYIPFTLGIGTAGTTSGSINFSSWPTGNHNDTVGSYGSQLPSDVTQFGNPNDDFYAVDRFWVIDAGSYGTKPTPNSLKFSYAKPETQGINTITESRLKAQRFNSTMSRWYDIAAIGVDTFVTGHYVIAPGISTANFFRSWTLTDSAQPLPITLFDFSANCMSSKVAIKWATASEINNSFFSVQKSHDGVEFTDFATIPGAGNSTTILNYSATDNSPYSDITYYRIKQTDYNGNFTYSPLAISQCGTDEFYIVKLYPNQLTQTTTLLFNADFDGPYHISVYDVLGNKVINLNNNAVKGPNQVVMDFSPLAHSVYLVNIGNGTKFITRKIVY
jgi:hypothetical protein